MKSGEQVKAKFTSIRKRLFVFINVLLTVFLLCGCQEAAITYETAADRKADAERKELEPVILYQEEISAEPFDPDLYFFPEEMLPQDTAFTGFDQKTLNISYLESDGNLLGLAHVRHYQAYQSDLFISQTIIQSLVPITSQMLKSGHFGDQYEEVKGDYLVGQEAVMLETGSTIFNEQHIISYRFYKGNAMVIIDLFGWNPFVNMDSIYELASTVYKNLPDEIPQPGMINVPSLQVHPELQSEYFNTLELVDCTGDHPHLDVFINGDKGICFHADILNLIKDLKVGIYSNHYSRLLYVKDFLYSPTLGDWTTTLMDTTWGYGWQHLPEGEYQALFWVDGQLVAAIPFDFIQ